MVHGLSDVTRLLREGKTECKAESALAHPDRMRLCGPWSWLWCWLAEHGPFSSKRRSLEYEPDVVLVIKEKAFHMVKGNAPKEHSLHQSFSLSPGEEITLELRNGDRVPHEFVSPLFAKVEFQFWGKATVVSTYTANGIRIDPGETVALRFELPKDFSGELFKFWCNVHGKLHGDVLQGEIFVVKPNHGTSG